MAISVNCGSCGQVYELSEQLAGRVLQCRRCGAAIQAPPANQGYRSTAPAYPAELIYPQQPAFLESPADYGGGYLGSGTPLPPARKRRRRKQNSGPLLWLAAAGGSLLGLAAVVAMIVASGMGPEGWVTLLNAPARERNKIRPITAPAADLAKRIVKPQQTPAPAVPAPYTGPSPEPILQKLVAAFHRVSSALGGVYDEASARQRQHEVAAGFREIGNLLNENQTDFPDLPAEESKRLKAFYDPQFKGAGEQIKREIERIARIPGAGRVLGPTLQMEGVNLQMKAMFASTRRFGGSARRQTNRLMRNQMAALAAPSPLQNIDPFAKFAEREVVEIVIRGLPWEFNDYVSDRLRSAVDFEMYACKGEGDSFRVTFGPVSDLRALAAKIDFGTVAVLDVSQSLLVVVVDSSQRPPPLPPEVSDPNAPLFYRQNLEDLTCWNGQRRRAAVGRLRNVAPKELRAEIARALIAMRNDGDIFLQDQVLEALAVWATAEEGVPVILEMLREHGSNYRMAEKAIQALGRFKDPRAVGPLLELTKTHPGSIVEALRAIGPAAEPEVLQYLDHPEAEIKKTAISALGYVGTARSIPRLQELAASSDFFIRSEAEQALKRLQAVR